MKGTELRQLWQLLTALLLLSGFTWCYAYGGRAGTSKAWRRFVGSLIFAAGCLCLARWSGYGSWWMVGALPSYPVALSLGYGGDALSTKLRKRTLYGLAVGGAGVWFLLPVSWPMALFQILLAVGASVFYGLLNPTSAVGEEGGMALLLVAVVPFGLIR